LRTGAGEAMPDLEEEGEEGSWWSGHRGQQVEEPSRKEPDGTRWQDGLSADSKDSTGGETPLKVRPGPSSV
jgi:hypothetical protein